MKLTILETKKITESRSWYLCKGNLLEYLEELKENFYDYAIQRKIVKNQYLDKLYTTIKSGDPIPTITLTYKKTTLDQVEGNSAHISLPNSEILDGLQRSFRLWTYLQLHKAYNESQDKNYRELAMSIKEQNQLFFDSGVLSTKLIKTLIESGEIKKIKDTLSKYDIYFTIWAGLNDQEVIKKMLILNAGQKSVTKTHQFELLFLHFFDSVQKTKPGVELFREKDSRANDVKRGIREVGDFMFSSIIVSLQSLVAGKPIRVSTEKLIDNEFDEEEDTGETTYDLVFNTKFLGYFLERLVQLDGVISKNQKGKEWFSKDTTLSGIFAAVGKKIGLSEIDEVEELYSKADEVFDTLTEKAERIGFDLDNFTNAYNIMSGRSGNIGLFIRGVVMNYTLALINGENPQWESIFSKLNERK